MTKKNIRSEYVKNLLAEKDNLGAMLSESTSEAIKSYLGESVNKGIRNILSEAEDSFTEEEVDDATPKLKKNSEKESKKSKKDDDKKSSKVSKKEKEDDENDSLDNDEDFVTDDEEIEIEDDFDDEGNGDDDLDSEDEPEEDFDSEDEPEDDFDSDNETEDDEFDADGYDDMESGDYDDDSDNEVWDSVEQFMGEDGEYDLTGQDKDTVMKVLKVMKPEDGVRIVKKDDETYELNDENNDVEYIITLNENEDMDYNEMDVEDDYRFNDNGDFEEDFQEEGDFSDENGDNFKYDEQIDVEDIPNEDGFGSEEFDYDEEFEEEDDNLEPMNDECLNEDNLGYDPHYGQDKTAMTMPSDTDDDNGSQIKMNAGLPKGSKNNGQRWVGNTNGKMAPYSTKKSETLYEVELDEDELDTDTTFSASEEPMETESTIAYGGSAKRLNGSSPEHKSAYGRTKNKVGAKKSNENFERKVKAIMAENKELKKIANEIKKRLEENVVVNASLGKIIKLMVENSTTKDEKVNILNRFNNVKSVKESKQLYEAISRELKQAHKNNTNSQMFGNQITEAKKTKQQIVENKLNESSDVKAMREFIKRLDKIS